jgi:hypothetical protein
MPRVVFVILDAFDPARLSPRLTPNLWRWANTDGAVSGAGWSVMASCTYPNHASFVTGVGPDQHGIHANHVIRDGQISGAWEVGPGRSTLFDVLSGIETEAVLGDHHLVGVMGASGATRHWPVDGDLSTVTDLDLLGYPADSAVLPVLLKALSSDAGLVVGYFGSIDTYSHVFGPDTTEVAESYRALDVRLADVDEILRSRWDDTVLVVVSDHIQDTALDRPGIDLHTAAGDHALVVDEGSAALLGGVNDPSLLDTVEGVEGWNLLADGNVLAWCGLGRFFGTDEAPILRGVHGGANTRTQLALVSGGHAARRELAASVAAGPVSPTVWAPGIARCLGRSF